MTVISSSELLHLAVNRDCYRKNTFDDRSATK